MVPREYLHPYFSLRHLYLWSSPCSPSVKHSLTSVQRDTQTLQREQLASDHSVVNCWRCVTEVHTPLRDERGMVYITADCLSLTNGQRSSSGVLQHTCGVSSPLHNHSALLVKVKTATWCWTGCGVSVRTKTKTKKKERFIREQKMLRNTHRAQANARTMHSSMHESHTHTQRCLCGG